VVEDLAQDEANPLSLQRETTGLTAVPREACRMVGVTPHHILLDGADPVTFILSANIHRRNLSKGQRAIAVAKLLETSEASPQTHES
jgi:hypothetical protein